MHCETLEGVMNPLRTLLLLLQWYGEILVPVSLSVSHCVLVCVMRLESWQYSDRSLAKWLTTLMSTLKSNMYDVWLNVYIHFCLLFDMSMLFLLFEILWAPGGESSHFTLLLYQAELCPSPFGHVYSSLFVVADLLITLLRLLLLYWLS